MTSCTVAFNIEYPYHRCIDSCRMHLVHMCYAYIIMHDGRLFCLNICLAALPKDNFVYMATLEALLMTSI